jgi:ribokinase
VIFVAGSANLDFVVRVPRIPSPGETVLGGDLVFVPGGKGANQAVASAWAGGAETEMLLAVGDDWLSGLIEASLRAAGVRLHKVVMPERHSGVAMICVSDDSENAIAVAPGANSELRGEHLPPLHGVSHLLLQLETPLPIVTAYARAAREQGVSVVLNAAPAQELPPGLLSAVDVLIVNESELAVVAGRQGSIADKLDRLDCPCTVVTLGARGCCASIGGKAIMEPGFPVASVDTTAAGDAFCGTFAAGLGDRRPLPAVIRRANAAGALACTRRGAQTSIPEQGELEAFLGNCPPPARGNADELRQYCGFKR